jgi:hypothetical protein
VAKLGWTDIRSRALKFSRDWEGVERENAESQTFWNEFFDVFGLRRRTVASFREPVKSIKDTYHFIDVFWKGKLLGEHKSAGQSLDRAGSQAFEHGVIHPSKFSEIFGIASDVPSLSPSASCHCHLVRSH